MNIHKGQKLANLLVVFFLLTLSAFEAFSNERETPAAGQLFSTSDDLNRLLQQVSLKDADAVFAFPIIESRLDGKNSITVSLDVTRNRITAYICHQRKIRWTKSITCTVMLYDNGAPASGRSEFGTVDEGVASFSNNYSKSQSGFSGKTSRTYYLADEKPAAPELLADLQRLYDLAVQAALQRSGSIFDREIAMRFKLEDLFKKYQLINDNDLATR